MIKRILGKNLEVSALGLGCMGMSHAYGAPADKKDMCELVAKAIDLGYTFFDTAEIYGTPDDPHANEVLVGEALKPYRKDIVLATKFGIHFDYTSKAPNKPLVPDARPDTIRKSVDESLLRLQTEYVDLYYQHRIDPSIAPEEVAGVMADLIKEGKILHWGISEVNEEYLRRAHTVCPVTAIQNRYSMMARWHEALFQVLEELHIGFVAFSPLANGFLSAAYNANSTFDKTTDYRAVMPQFQKEAFAENEQLLDTILEFAAAKHATPAQLALAWMLSKKPYIVPIPGTRKYTRLKENAGAADIFLSQDELNMLEKLLAISHMSAVFGGTQVKK